MSNYITSDVNALETMLCFQLGLMKFEVAVVFLSDCCLQITFQQINY